MIEHRHQRPRFQHILVCRKRAADAPIATRREFVTALKAELPEALAQLQRGNIARWIWRRPPSALAWPSTPAMQGARCRR